MDAIITETSEVVYLVSGNGLSTPVIVVICLVIILVLVLVVFFICRCCCGRCKKDNRVVSEKVVITDEEIAKA